MKLIEHELCTGCMACMHVCPKKAIIIESDEIGNAFPKIIESECINCEICGKTCPQMKPVPERNIMNAYASWALDPFSRKRSASGGVAAEFYTQAIQSGYWICGVKYTDSFKVIHCVTKDVNDIEGFRQSKYVFSETNIVYNRIEELLNSNEKVLFISLPCKVAGLLGYLGKKYDNLITIDIVCHGTPSYTQLIEHIQTIDPESISKQIRFREDNQFVFELFDVNGNCVYKKTGRTDSYLAAFLEGLNYRESCYHCSYAKPKRISDMTICDFWGIGSEIPFNHPYTGSISAILVNTETGKAFLEKCRNRLFLEERNIDEAVRGNAQLNEPSQKHEKFAEFKNSYKIIGFDQAVKTCLKDVMKTERKTLIKRKLKSIIRSTAKLIFKREKKC